MVDNDVIGLVSPDTGAREIDLEVDAVGAPGNKVPVALYTAQLNDPGAGDPSSELTILYRFKPTLAQRGKIALGEDLFLAVIMPEGSALAPLELQVGAGVYELKTGLVDAGGEDLVRGGPVLWTPGG